MADDPAPQDAASRRLTIFVVATEESGDRLGAALMRALKRLRGEAVRFLGVGGHAMAAEGLVSLFAADDLAIVGLLTVPRRLPVIFRRIRETADAALAARPDVMVIIDSPDFTHRVARRVRKADPSIPIVDYVSPSVWAWRPGRARAMRAYVDHILALLPFEPQVHAQLGGPPCTYVGHPLVEQAGELRPNVEEARRRSSAPPVVLVLPGSRQGEIQRLLGPFGKAMAMVQDRAGALDVVVPTTPQLAERVARETSYWRFQPRIIVAPDEKRAAFRIAHAALAKSGTVTLELAIAGVPMVAAYKVMTAEAAVMRWVLRGSSVILANLVLGENVVPEFLQESCTPKNLANALLPLLSDTAARQRQINAFAKLDDIMEIGRVAPARRAAEIVLALAEKAGRR